MAVIPFEGRQFGVRDCFLYLNIHVLVTFSLAFLVLIFEVWEVVQKGLLSLLLKCLFHVFQGNRYRNPCLVS